MLPDRNMGSATKKQRKVFMSNWHIGVAAGEHELLGEKNRFLAKITGSIA